MRVRDDASRRAFWLVFGATGLSAWIATATMSTINVGLANIQADFPQYKLATIGWIITSFNVIHAALLVPAGRLADRLGRRKVYNSGLALFGLGAAVSAVAPSFALLIAGRVLQGAGAAVFGPASLGLLLEITPSTERVKTIALFSACTTLGGTAGPTLGAAIIDAGGWRWALAMPAFVIVIVWLVGRPYLPRSHGDGSTVPLDYAGTIQATLALAMLVLAIAEGRAWGWTSPRILALLVASAVISAWLIYRIVRTPHAIIPKSLFESRSFSIGLVATCLMGVVGGSIQLVNILFLRGIWGYSPLRAGLAITPAPLFASLFSPLSARLGSRYGERATAVPSMIIFGLCVAWFAMLDETPRYWTHFFPVAAIHGAVVALTFPMVQAATIRDVPIDKLSVANATSRAISQVGQAVGVAAGLSIIGTGLVLKDFHKGYIFLMTSMLMATVVVACIRPGTPASRASISVRSPAPTRGA